MFIEFAFHSQLFLLFAPENLADLCGGWTSLGWHVGQPWGL